MQLTKMPEEDLIFFHDLNSKGKIVFAKIIQTMDALINPESTSLYIIWVIKGMIINNPRIICKIPNVKKTVL